MEYRVERMTSEAWDAMMGGAWFYNVEKVVIEADTPEEAANKAKRDGYVVNRDYVRLESEAREEEERKAARIAEWEAKEAARKAKAAARRTEKKVKA